MIRLTPKSMAFKIKTPGAGEMVHHLRDPAALPEDPASCPSTHMAVHNLTLASGESDALLWFLQVLHAHGTQNTSQQIFKINTKQILKRDTTSI